MTLSVPLWLTSKPTLSEFVFSSKDIAEMLSKRYFICVLFVGLTGTVLLLARMNCSRELRREFVKKRLEEAIVTVRRARSNSVWLRSSWSFEISPSTTNSFVSSTLMISLIVSFSRITSLPFRSSEGAKEGPLN